MSDEKPPQSDDPGIHFVEDAKPVLFSMTTPDDTGQGFKPIVLPKPEPPPPPPPSAAAEPPRPDKEERLAAAAAARRARSRRSFLMGLAAGQAVIVGVNLGVPLLVRLARDRVRFEGDHLPILVLLGVLGGVGIIALVIFLLLALAGLASLWRGGRVGRGIRRVLRAGTSIVLTTAVLGGTALLMVPHEQWPGIPGQAKKMAVEAWKRLKEPPPRQP